jgi:hypothetical protein
VYSDCRECERLWQEFSDATKAHIAILAKAQLAEIEQNNAVITVLSPLTMAAGERRGKARMALRVHEATHRNRKDADATGIVLSLILFLGELVNASAPYAT